MVAVGVDVGGTKCLAVALDAEGQVVSEERLATPDDPGQLVDAIVEAARAVGADEGASVGVGVPGLVTASGVLRFAPNLPEVRELDLRTPLAARLGGQVAVENDANCAAWGERAIGAARGADHAVVVTLGTGIGGGIVTGGALYRGANGFAGEVGHMVVDPDGPECPCGRRGCWERFASGSALAALAGRAAEAGRMPRVVELAGGHASAVRGEHVTQAASEGDEGALRVMSTFARWVALGLSNLANVFDPEVLVLGGGLVDAGDLLLDPVRAAFASLVEAPEHRPVVPIVAAVLGDRAGAIGAAGLAARR